MCKLGVEVIPSLVQSFKQSILLPLNAPMNALHQCISITNSETYINEKEFYPLWYPAWVLSSLSAQAQLPENFNSRPGVSTSMVKAHLQSKLLDLRRF